MILPLNLKRLAMLLLVGIGTSRAALMTDPPVDAAVERPVFPADVERVIVDVAVVDNEGQPVAGLTPRDFLIKEDGTPQTIVEFEAIEIPEAYTQEAPSSRSRVSSNTDELRRFGRIFVIVFDGLNLSPASANEARAAVEAFLQKSVSDGDLVCLVATQSTTWWTARMPQGREEILDLLKRQRGAREQPHFVQDWMSDYEAMRIAEYHDSQVAAQVWRRWKNAGIITLSSEEPTTGRIEGMILSRASEFHALATQRISATLAVVRRALDSMSDVKGRKSLILLSEGFVYNPNMLDYRRVDEASRRSSTTVYFINTSGLSGMSDLFSASVGQPMIERDLGSYLIEPSLSSEGGEVIASASGGFSIRNTNALEDGMSRIARESRKYYLIGYQPINEERDGSYREITVDVNRRDVKVRARRGYWAPDSESEKVGSAKPRSVRIAVAKTRESMSSVEKTPIVVNQAFQRALDSPYDSDDIPLRMTGIVGDESKPGTAKVFLVADVDVRVLLFTEEQGRFVDALQTLLIAVHRKTGESHRYDQKISLNLKPETRTRWLQTGYTIVREFELVPGHYQARLIVVDNNSGRLGSVTHDFIVPDLDQLRTSTPLLTDRMELTREGVPVPVLIARRFFDRRSDLAFHFEVYGAETDPATSAPRVSSSHALLTGDGAILREWKSSVIPPDEGRITRLTGFSLKDLAPGDYQIAIRVKDEVSGRAIETREPFEVFDRTREPAQTR